MGCYSKGEGDDQELCQSGKTYQQGFKTARATLKTPVCLWENVRDVLFNRADSSGVKRPPEVETVTNDMAAQGCDFAHYLAETSKFLLPQRRNRVYGIVSQSEQRPERFQQDYERVMTLFESYARSGFQNDQSYGPSGPQIILEILPHQL